VDGRRNPRCLTDRLRFDQEVAARNTAAKALAKKAARAPGAGPAVARPKQKRAGHGTFKKQRTSSGAAGAARAAERSSGGGTGASGGEGGDGPKFKGVYRRGPGKYAVTVCWPHNNGQERLGPFKTPEAAARAYDEAALRLIGSHAMLNYLPDGTLNPHRRNPNKNNSRNAAAAAGEAKPQLPKERQVAARRGPGTTRENAIALHDSSDDEGEEDGGEDLDLGGGGGLQDAGAQEDGEGVVLSGEDVDLGEEDVVLTDGSGEQGGGIQDGDEHDDGEDLDLCGERDDGEDLDLCGERDDGEDLDLCGERDDGEDLDLCGERDDGEDLAVGDGGLPGGAGGDIGGHASEQEDLDLEPVADGAAFDIGNLGIEVEPQQQLLAQQQVVQSQQQPHPQPAPPMDLVPDLFPPVPWQQPAPPMDLVPQLPPPVPWLNDAHPSDTDDDMEVAGAPPAPAAPPMLLSGSVGPDSVAEDVQDEPPSDPDLIGDADDSAAQDKS